MYICNMYLKIICTHDINQFNFQDEGTFKYKVKLVKSAFNLNFKRNLKIEITQIN